MSKEKIYESRKDVWTPKGYWRAWQQRLDEMNKKK